MDVIPPMTAAVPPFLLDMAAFVGALAIICGGMTALARWRPVRFVVRRAVGDPLGEWFVELVEHATERIRHLIDYHLGSNGTTMPIHERISRLETAAGLKAIEQQDKGDDEH